MELDGVWRRATLYNLISRTTDPGGGDICLYFGDEEYEGLPPHTYDLDNNRLFDSDHDEIKIRNLDYSV